MLYSSTWDQENPWDYLGILQLFKFEKQKDILIRLKGTRVHIKLKNEYVVFKRGRKSIQRTLSEIYDVLIFINKYRMRSNYVLEVLKFCPYRNT